VRVPIRRSSKNRADAGVNIDQLVGLAGFQIECDKLGVCNRKAKLEIETIDHTPEGVEVSIHIEQGGELPIGGSNKGCGPCGGIDLVQTRRNVLVGPVRQSPGRFRRSGRSRLPPPFWFGPTDMWPGGET
jgi:hypothetical protein